MWRIKKMTIQTLIENGRDEQVGGSWTIGRAQIELDRFESLEHAFGRFLVHEDINKLRKELDVIKKDFESAIATFEEEQENCFPY